MNTGLGDAVNLAPNFFAYAFTDQGCQVLRSEPGLITLGLIRSRSGLRQPLKAVCRTGAGWVNHPGSFGRSDLSRLGVWLTGWQQERSAVDFLGQLLRVPPSLAVGHT